MSDVESKYNTLQNKKRRYRKQRFNIQCVYMNFLGKTTVLTFLTGIFVGLIIGLLIMMCNRDEYSYYAYDVVAYSSSINFGPVGDHSKTDTHHKMLNYSLADKLFNEVKILCWVPTMPLTHHKAKHVRETWGKRCNKLIFLSSEQDSDLPAVALPVREGRRYLWHKTRESLKYLYKHYYQDYDWFFKADVDTYVVMENLRYLLYYSNSSDPVYYGCRMKGPDHSPDVVYMSGGAGYVLSKEALKRFNKDAVPNKYICRQKDTGDEDLELGKCLAGVDVKPGHSLDNENRNLFTPLFVNKMLIPGYLDKVDWYMNMMFNPENQGFSCCSDNLISTHYVSPYHMYLLEYLIYHVTPFGIAYQPILHNQSSRGQNTRYYSDGISKGPTWKDFD